MTENCSSPNKGIFSATICANKQIRQGFYRLKLKFSGAAAQSFAKARPGQFAELDISGIALPESKAIPEELTDISERKILLRRPFSFCDVTSKDNKTTVEILYCVVGPASLRMTTLSAGDSLNVIGPLGNGFSITKNKKTALFVAGGMGVGPLLYLAKIITNDYPDTIVTALVGAKTKEELPFKGRLDEIAQQLGFSLPEFAMYSIESSVATDDGSVGYKGFVTDFLAEWLGQNDLEPQDTIIYSCGPKAMLAKIADIAQEKKIDCQVCTEQMMACGIGLCQSCAVECKVSNSNETIYKLCCKDGPVFDSREVIFRI